MDTTHRRRVELGRMGLASDAAAQNIARDCARHRTAPDMTARAVQARHNLHRATARERIAHDALLGLLDGEFLALCRYAYDEASVRHEEEQGAAWFKVGSALEDLISALDHALAKDAARRAA